MLRNVFYTVGCVAMFSVAVFAQANTAAPTPTPAAKKINERPVETPPAEPYDKADVKTMASKCVKLETEVGDIEMEMFPESALESVRSFLNLVATGLLDTTTFSRVVPDFVVQGGNIWTRQGPVSMEMGRRARRALPDEPSKILHERGIVSMARGDEPNTATTNFFILVSSGSHLDGTFAAFGRVTHGMEIVDSINKMPVTGEKPDKPVRIKKATVITCGVQSASFSSYLRDKSRTLN